jgi:hypothetical protein
MGWFSKRPPGQTRLWREFDGLDNGQETLERKADRLSLLLLETARMFAEHLRHEILPKTDFATLYLECLAMDLHMLDRLAFNNLGEGSRNTFQDRLMVGIAISLGNHSPSSEISGRDFVEDYNQRTRQYIDCELSPPDNGHGGLDFEHTFAFQLAQHLGVATDVFTETHLEVVIAAHYFAVIDNLQLRELLLGYQQT